MALLDDVKKVLRISNNAYDTEITDLINAALAELKLSGVTAESAMDIDPLIKKAVNTYVKSEFGWNNPDAEKLRQSFEILKIHLTLSCDYAFYTVSFTITDGTDPIENANIEFSEKVISTDEDGKAAFRGINAGNAQAYNITADGYIAVIGELDITASAEVEITMSAG